MLQYHNPVKKELYSIRNHISVAGVWGVSVSLWWKDMLKSKYFELRNHQQYENRRKHMTYIKYPYKKAKRSSIGIRKNVKCSGNWICFTQTTPTITVLKLRTITLKMIPTLKMSRFFHLTICHCSKPFQLPIVRDMHALNLTSRLWELTMPTSDFNSSVLIDQAYRCVSSMSYKEDSCIQARPSQVLYRSNMLTLLRLTWSLSWYDTGNSLSIVPWWSCQKLTRY